MTLVKLILLFVIGMFAIIKGADLFTEAAVWIAAKTGIPKVIVGATIVSLATTLPEFAVSVFASATGHPEMSLGNAVGSNIFNIGVILGISLIIRSFSTDRNIFGKQAFFMIFASILTFFLASDGTLNPLDGVIIFMVLIAYIVYVISSARHSGEGAKKEAVEGTAGANLLKFLVGAAAVVIGSRITVNAGIDLAHLFGVPELIIGLTLVAVGTSLPELVTSLTATLKGYQELSVGNILGAGLLNMSWVVAVSSMVNPIPIVRLNLTLDFPFMLALMTLLLLFGLTKDRLTRWEGIVLLSVYVAYMTILFAGRVA